MFPFTSLPPIRDVTLAMGNRVIAVPSPRHPLSATKFYQVLDTSDMPARVVNIDAGERDAHGEVDGMWCVGPAAGSAWSSALRSAT